MRPENACLTDLHRMLGAKIVAQGMARFCVWAPNHDHVDVELVDRDRRVRMTKSASGYHLGEVSDVQVGDRYGYRLADGPLRPDPVSRSQPEGVHGPSQIVDVRFDWNDHDWTAPSTDELVIYEAHVGALTDEGTFLAVIDRLDELVELGITAIELMPVAQCPGRWNWGYDGVNWFAPSHHYGTPHDLRCLVDAAHQKGLAVILDVVYNHLGPEGNYLGDFGPYFSSHHSTPWGAAPNLDDPGNADEVRRFVIANAVYWIDEFHVDGLRVDAIHCIGDDSETHISAEITDAVRDWSARSGRDALLIAESNVYDPQMLRSRNHAGIGFDGQWCDDLLHSVSAVVRPDDQLCHRVYRPATDLEQTLRMGYVFEGTLSEQRGRRPPGDRVDTTGLIYSIQQHDFVGNHPQGMRFHQLTSVDTQRAAAVLLFLLPGIPMVFMGEEFACDHPFRFFVDFGDPVLRNAVTEGRQREYPQHDWDSGLLPTDDRTFTESKIGPRTVGDMDLFSWYQALIRLRKQLKLGGTLSDENLNVKTDLANGVFVLKYQGSGETVVAAVRLLRDGESTACQWTPDAEAFEVLIDSRPDQTRPGQLLPNHAKILREVPHQS